jgi:CRISPR-associated protein Csb1
MDNGQPKLDSEGKQVPQALTKKEGNREVQAYPSDINHGNVTPSVSRAKEPLKGPGGTIIEDRDRILPGGITMRYAEQTSVLSMAALRRLRFPPSPGPAPTQATNPAAPDTSPPSSAAPSNRDEDARMMLTALGLVAMVCSRRDYFLRSRCDLYAPGPIKFEIVQPGVSQIEEFTLDLAQGAALLNQVAAQSSATWKRQAELETFQPSQRLADLIRESRRRGGSEGESQ